VEATSVEATALTVRKVTAMLLQGEARRSKEKAFARRSKEKQGEGFWAEKTMMHPEGIPSSDPPLTRGACLVATRATAIAVTHQGQKGLAAHTVGGGG
jgi:hypothetical protein